MRALGPAFRALDDLARSAAFLRALSRLTGIPGLLYDPSYHGGGAQENREGMRLWPHIDFNHDLKSGWRRLNLLLYLNDGWRRGDGGRLQLHASPRSRPALSVEPVFNRCVIFETSQRSWHSVEPVAEGRSRRSVSLYFYTAEAPLPLVPPHRTVWEYPPLPRQARAGAVLDEPLLAAIRRVLTLRDEELAAFGAPSPAEPLPRDWAAGRSLSAEDASWLRAELSRRDEALQRCWRPFKN